MRLILKILFAPLIAVMTLLIWIAQKAVQLSAIVLNAIALLTALGAICIMLDGRTAHGIAGLVAAFLLTPFGLPLLAMIFLTHVEEFKEWIQNRVYG